jgi:hypothetical protein
MNNQHNTQNSKMVSMEFHANSFLVKLHIPPTNDMPMICQWYTLHRAAPAPTGRLWIPFVDHKCLANVTASLPLRLSKCFNSFHIVSPSIISQTQFELHGLIIHNTFIIPFTSIYHHLPCWTNHNQPISTSLNFLADIWQHLTTPSQPRLGGCPTHVQQRAWHQRTNGRARERAKGDLNSVARHMTQCLMCLVYLASFPFFSNIHHWHHNHNNMFSGCVIGVCLKHVSLSFLSNSLTGLHWPGWRGDLFEHVHLSVAVSHVSHVTGTSQWHHVQHTMHSLTVYRCRCLWSS